MSYLSRLGEVAPTGGADQRENETAERVHRKPPWPLVFLGALGLMKPSLNVRGHFLRRLADDAHKLVGFFLSPGHL